MKNIGILIVFCSVGFVYADKYMDEYSLARPENGPSNPVSRYNCSKAVQDTICHSSEVLKVNNPDTSIFPNLNHVDFAKIYAKEYKNYRNLANNGCYIPKNEVVSNPASECVALITQFFASCEDCRTYLDYAKYILLYVVYFNERMGCIRQYMNYVVKAMKISNERKSNDKYRVTSPKDFCESLDPNKHIACKKQMRAYFGPGFSLYHNQKAMGVVFFNFDLRHIQQQQDSGFIEGYVRHVKNRFYYDRSRLPNSEEVNRFCTEVYDPNIVPGEDSG